MSSCSRLYIYKLVTDIFITSPPPSRLRWFQNEQKYKKIEHNIRKKTVKNGYVSPRPTVLILLKHGSLPVELPLLLFGFLSDLAFKGLICPHHGFTK